MTISIENYKQNTLWERIELWNLMQSGRREWEAINALWPLKDTMGRRQNSSRMSKFKTWNYKGVWPPSEQELSQAEAMGLLRQGLQRETRSESVNCLDINTLRARVSTAHRDSIVMLPTRDRTPTEHLGARIPVRLKRDIAALDGSVTAHVVRALDLYLSVLEECNLTLKQHQNS